MARRIPRPLPELPPSLETFREWEWDGDKSAWIHARCAWMRENWGTKEIARRMERARVERRRETERRQRLEE